MWYNGRTRKDAGENSMADTLKIEKEIQKLNLNQYSFIDPKELPFSQEVRDMCAQNACGRHGTNWQCPPGAGELSVLEARAKSFESAMLFNMVYKIEDSYDFEGMMAAQQSFSKTCNEVLLCVRSEYPQSYVMGAGGCNICAKCTYPNEPCRFPDRAIASMEACGIDVFSTSKKFGFEYIGGINTVTYFGVVFFRK
jgi:predicted metal-binding protein